MFEITDGRGKWLRSTDSYTQAIWWARYYVTNCGADNGTSVWLGASFTEVYRTF